MSNSHNNKFLVNELISILESESIKNTIYKDLVNMSIKDHELDILLISTLEKLHLANKTNIVFKLAKKTDISFFGSLGFALMSCSNLEESAKLLIRYQSLTDINGISLKYLNTEQGSIIRLNINIGNPLQKRIISELVLSQIIHIGKTITGGLELNKTQVRFKHDGDYSNEYKQLFKVDVSFNNDSNELFIPFKLNSINVTSYNKSANILFQNECERLLKDLNSVENFSSTTRRMLLNAGDNFPNINNIAFSLNMSESTLRRRLDEEGTNFRRICDEVRNVLACNYLENTSLTINEIAMLLNYSEPASFRRAFMRWNKVAPNDYRKSSS